jgi:hypothetical protein
MGTSMSWATARRSSIWHWGVIVLFILVYEGQANFQNCLIYMYIYKFGWIFSVS